MSLFPMYSHYPNLLQPVPQGHPLTLSRGASDLPNQMFIAIDHHLFQLIVHCDFPSVIKFLKIKKAVFSLSI
jgi:hypothetical protein